MKILNQIFVFNFACPILLKFKKEEENTKTSEFVQCSSIYYQINKQLVYKSQVSQKINGQLLHCFKKNLVEKWRIKNGKLESMNHS